MAGTAKGGQVAAEKNKERYGGDFYNKIGTLGGSKSRGGGFAYGDEGRERARKYGAIGGRHSKRGKAKPINDTDCAYCGLWGHAKRECQILTADRERNKRLLAKYGAK